MQRKHLAAAAIAVTAALGLGGGIAAAQTDDDTSTTEPATADRPEGCDDAAAPADDSSLEGAVSP